MISITNSVFTHHPRLHPNHTHPAVCAPVVGHRRRITNCHRPLAQSICRKQSIWDLKMDFRRLGRIELRARGRAAGQASGGAR